MRCVAASVGCPALYAEEPGGDFIAIGEELDKDLYPVAENETVIRIPRAIVFNLMFCIVRRANVSSEAQVELLAALAEIHCSLGDRDR